MLILLQPFLSRPTRQKHGESEASSHLQDSMPVKKNIKHSAQGILEVTMFSSYTKQYLSKKSIER
jgi:hypothetical protein